MMNFNWRSTYGLEILGRKGWNFMKIFLGADRWINHSTEIKLLQVEEKSWTVNGNVSSGIIKVPNLYIIQV